MKDLDFLLKNLDFLLKNLDLCIYSTVPEGSKCPTFAATVLKVDNARWSGVPFLMKAGKGLDERMAEVRVKFKPQAYNKLMGANLPGNELVMRIQVRFSIDFLTVFDCIWAFKI